MKRRLFYGLLVAILLLVAGYAWWNQRHPSADTMPGMMACTADDKVIDLVTVQTTEGADATVTFYSRTGRQVLTEMATLMQKTDADAKLVKASPAVTFVPFGNFTFGSSWSNQVGSTYPTTAVLQPSGSSQEEMMMSGGMNPQYYVELVGNTVNNKPVSSLSDAAGNKVVLAVNASGGQQNYGMSCVASTGNLVDDLKGLDVSSAQVVVSDFILKGQVQVNGYAGLTSAEQATAKNDTKVEVKRDGEILPVKVLNSDSSSNTQWVLPTAPLAGTYSIAASTSLRQPNMADPVKIMRKANPDDNTSGWLDDYTKNAYAGRIIGYTAFVTVYPPGRDGTWSIYWGAWYPEGLYNGGINVASGNDIAVSTGLVSGPIPSVWLGGVHYVDYYWFKLDIVDWHPRLSGQNSLGESSPECSSGTRPVSTYGVTLFQSDWSDTPSGLGGFTSPPPVAAGQPGTEGGGPTFKFDVNYCDQLNVAPILVPVGTDKTLTAEQIKAYLNGSYSITKIGTNGHGYNDTIGFRDVFYNNKNLGTLTPVEGDPTVGTPPTTGDAGNGGDTNPPAGKLADTPTPTGSTDTSGNTDTGGTSSTKDTTSPTTPTPDAVVPTTVPITESPANWMTPAPYIEVVQRVADAVRDAILPNKTVTLPTPPAVEAPKAVDTSDAAAVEVVKSPLELLRDSVTTLQNQTNEAQAQYNAADKKTRRTLVKNLNKLKSRLKVGKRNLARAPRTWAQLESSTARYTVLYNKAVDLQAANPKARATKTAVRNAQSANRAMQRLQKTWNSLLKF